MSDPQETTPPLPDLRYRLPERMDDPERRQNPLHLPLFTHVPSIVHQLLHSYYFTAEDWDRWFDYYRHSSAFGTPCDLFRNIEYLYVEKELALESGLRILDIGTGASVFPSYLALQKSIGMTILDLDNYGFESQRQIHQTLELPFPRLVQGDATHPPFLPHSFDRVIAVSAIEHFPESGDMAFMKAAWEMLTPGGLCIVTVPYRTTFEENHNVHHYHGGFERRYNRQAIQERLWNSGSWTVERELYMNPGLTPLAEKMTNRHGRLDYFFDKWYETRSNIQCSHDSLWYTLLLIELSDVPVEDCMGTCFTLRKREG